MLQFQKQNKLKKRTTYDGDDSTKIFDDVFQ